MTPHIGSTSRTQGIRSANLRANYPIRTLAWGLLIVSIGQGLFQLLTR